jgi:hypothetical protein
MRTITSSVHFENTINGRESQGASRQDEHIGSKLPGVKHI